MSNDTTEMFPLEAADCNECGEVSEKFDAYIEHKRKGDCVFWCNDCDKFFDKRKT
jgi:hypothetical protein